MQSDATTPGLVSCLVNAMPGVPPIELEKLLFNLSPQQRRLTIHLAQHGESDSQTIRNLCRITNITVVAKHVNDKFAASGLRKYIACQRRAYETTAGNRNNVGFWWIADGDAA